jgi:hypothetical protein
VLALAAKAAVQRIAGIASGFAHGHTVLTEPAQNWRKAMLALPFQTGQYQNIVSHGTFCRNRRGKTPFLLQRS